MRPEHNTTPSLLDLAASGFEVKLPAEAASSAISDVDLSKEGRCGTECETCGGCIIKALLQIRKIPLAPNTDNGDIIEALQDPTKATNIANTNNADIHE